MAPRKHHYLPVWYLAGFTLSGRASGRLWVLDLCGQRVWRSLPEKVACQRDLYTVSSGPTPPDLFECQLAKRDDADATLVRKVCQSQQLSGECLDDLLRFVARTYVRSPSMRAHLTRHVEGVAGRPFSLWIDPLVDSMLPLLRSRKWSLCSAEGEYGFVCSGSPVAVTWPEEHVSGEAATFGDAGAIVTFPLDRSTALVAGIHPHHGWGQVGKEAVAEVNSQTLLALKRNPGVQPFVFSSSGRFLCAGKDGLLQVIGTDFALVDESADPADDHKTACTGT